MRNKGTGTTVYRTVRRSTVVLRTYLLLFYEAMLAVRGMLRTRAWKFAPSHFQRWFCNAGDSSGELATFLSNASRPKMGKAKAKQSAGQKALDLMKQLPRLEGLTLPDFLGLRSADLRKRGTWNEHLLIIAWTSRKVSWS